jgi:arylsulfatase A-like enzyme/Tfp pilus assembly protein PilF
MGKRTTRKPSGTPRTPRRPGRSRLLIWTGAAAVCALGAYWWTARPRGPALVRLTNANVLLITIDTLRADALGCDGGAASTPGLDRLAAAGTRYTFAHAHAPVTLVSHASILSGLYPFQHGIRDNSGFRFPRSIPTLATRLKGAGLATGAFVGAFPLHSQFGLNAGFGVYDENFKETGLPTDFSMSERPATAVVAAARPWIASQRGRWFAWVHVFDPHAPYRPPEPFASRYASNPYAGEVAATDAALAPLLDDVRRAERPTLVVVTGDHGEALGDHGEQTHSLFAYESTLRVPLIIAELDGGRGDSRAGSVSNDLVRHVDIAPTVLDIVGERPDPALPGRSLLSPAPEPEAIASYFEALSASLNRGWAPLTGVIVGREKFVQLPIPELYDLTADPAETQNLIDGRPDRRRALEARLRDLQATGPDGRREEDPATKARLSALGYVSGSAAAHRGPYTENDDPKRLIDLDRKIHDAIELFQRGDRERAVSLYREILERRPDSAIAYAHLGFVLWEMDRRDEAIATLERARAAGVSDPMIDSKLGMYLSETGRAREGLPLLERAAAHPAADVDTLNTLAIGYARAGLPDRALATFHRVLDLEPGSPMAWQNIGSVELERGHAATARDAFRRALQADSNWAAAYTGLGVAERRLGNFDAAVESWKRAVALDPAQFDALYNLATELASAGRRNEARPYAERFVATAPAAEYRKDIEKVKAYLR